MMFGFVPLSFSVSADHNVAEERDVTSVKKTTQ
jgi:hypothetical protein